MAFAAIDRSMASLLTLVGSGAVLSQITIEVLAVLTTHWSILKLVAVSRRGSARFSTIVVLNFLGKTAAVGVR